MDEHSKKMNKELEDTKKNKIELKNTIIEIKNTLKGINSRSEDTEEWISGNHWSWTEKRTKRNEDSLRDFWDNIKHTNICIIGIPEGEERQKGAENIFEDIRAENFHNLGKERHPGPGSTESPNQDQPKEDHNKTHCNQNGENER